MPGGVTTPQGTFAGINPAHPSRFGWFPVVDARREIQKERAKFARARRAEAQYAVNLRKIARHIGEIVRGMMPGLFDPSVLAEIERALSDYARLIGPWASATAARMLSDVERRDRAVWSEHGRKIGRLLRQEIETAPIAPAFQEYQRSQVGLIKSLPEDAALRVHELSTEAMLGGRRWEEIAEDILASGQVSKSKANLIARTESSRAQTNFTAIRAQHIGSEGYIWWAVMDKDTRPRHRELNGTPQRWDDPPVASEPGQKEMRYHAGAGPNCRCHCEPIIPALED
jgi:SPP1 gp7 family putative phage head morphogenesis protein